jgi:hypothetical protein
VTLRLSKKVMGILALRAPDIRQIGSWKVLAVSLDKRRIEIISAVIRELTEQGKKEVRPGDVAEKLRSSNSPIGVWQIRADFAQLTDEGFLELEHKSGSWRLA